MENVILKFDNLEFKHSKFDQHTETIMTLHAVDGRKIEATRRLLPDERKQLIKFLLETVL